MHFLRQSTAATDMIGPFVDNSDGVTAETGLAGEGTELSKNGAAFGAGSVLGTHDSEGWYPISLTTTHTNTVGTLTLKAQESGTHLAVFKHYTVLEEAVYDALFAASAPGPTTGFGGGPSAIAITAGGGVRTNGWRGG